MRLLGWANRLVLAIAALATLTVATVTDAATTPATTSVITMAEAPGGNPNFIFPYMSCGYDSTNNTEYFQRLMYRPLYWIGLGTSLRVQYPLSPANAPRFSNGGKSVTVAMKGWRFANGEVVDASSVKFFLNLLHADPTGNCDYQPGTAIPDQLTSVVARGNQLQLGFNRAQNATMLLYRFLSQVTPLPASWDLAAANVGATCEAGAYGAASTDQSCNRVLAYLTSLALQSGSYTGRLWQGGVDGPWRLSAFDARGDASFVANPGYSGPQRPRVATFKEVAFANAPAVLAALANGTVSMSILGPTSIPPLNGSTAAAAPAAAAAPSYRGVTALPWSINFAAINYSAADPDAAEVAQLYIRQALQETIDQPALIKDVLNGYGAPTESPIPVATPTFMSPPITSGYAFDPTGAAQLLTAHGWVLANGVWTCRSPGVGSNDCGAGINAGQPLRLRVVWSSGDPTLTKVMTREALQWSTLGIQVSTAQDAPGNLVSDCRAPTAFDLCAWGGGWSFAPDYYPSGESLFGTSGLMSSVGDHTLAILLARSEVSMAALAPYATYAARQLPVIYEPQLLQTYEVSKGLHSSIGLAPNTFHSFTPEYFW